LVNFNYPLQKIDYTLSFFFNAIAFSYHQGKRPVSLIREFWDTLYIKMNRRSLVSLKLKNGSTDLNDYFFILFALLQGWFKKKKNRKSCPENWKIREKLKVLFSVGTAGTIRQIVFFNVRNNPYEVFM
jgi:hypothetical protein